jgi:hypothetical protein
LLASGYSLELDFAFFAERVLVWSYFGGAWADGSAIADAMISAAGPLLSCVLTMCSGPLTWAI